MPTGRTGFKRRNEKIPPDAYKGFLIKFSVNRYSVLAEVKDHKANLHSLREYKSQALADIKRQIDRLGIIGDMEDHFMQKLFAPEGHVFLTNFAKNERMQIHRQIHRSGRHGEEEVFQHTHSFSPNKKNNEEYLQKYVNELRTKFKSVIVVPDAFSVNNEHLGKDYVAIYVIR